MLAPHSPGRTLALATVTDDFDRDAYLRAMVRAGAGGLLFGVPLLYTNEMWAAGSTLAWWKILLLLAVSFFLVVAFTRIEGFRRDTTLRDALWDGAVSMGLGIVIAAGMLAILGQVGSRSSLREWVGQVAVEAIAVAIGASVARGLLGEGHDPGDPDSEPGPLGQGLVAAGGALFFALNVAPTEEPMMIGFKNDWWLILALLVLMVPVSFAIVFYADFRGSHRKRKKGGELSPLLTPIGETILCLVAALLVSAALLWFFGRIGPGVGAGATLHQIVSLGFVSAIGASAARLLL